MWDTQSVFKTLIYYQKHTFLNGAVDLMCCRFKMRILFFFLSEKELGNMEADYGSSMIGRFCRHFRKPKKDTILCYAKKRFQNSESFSSENPDGLSMDAGPSSCGNSSSSSSHPDCICPALSSPSSSSHCICTAQGLSVCSTRTRTYDVCVCHSDENVAQAHALVTFLESPSRGLRCFLRMRDCPLGGAVSSELCNAVQSSHCSVLLISPSFLTDDWCMYQMHQALSEGPMSQRIIPAVLDMHISEIPHELRFLYIVDLNRNHEAGYTRVYRAVLQCENFK
uniref:Toll-interleukin 1 receptor (TIR) domain containing adaptor protein n=1 Tax=Astyanax mexicanus TaxID=7994 RepID=A0A3B1J303_ASTMX